MTLTVRKWDDSCSWNRFVAESPRASFQQSWEWGELTPDLGGEVIRLAVAEGGQIRACMQVGVNPINYAGGTYLYVPRGPVVCEPSMQLLAPLMDAARAIADEKGSLGVRMEPEALAGDERWASLLRALGLRPTYPSTQPRSSWVLDIALDPEILLGSMKQKTRYNIRLAEKKGVEIGEGSRDDLDEFYALYRETAERDDFFIQGLGFYRRMFDLFSAQHDFSLLLARYKGELIAAVTLLRFGRTCWYMQGASSNRYRNLMATYLLQWEAIKQARSWGCDTYDFRAVPDRLEPAEEMYGVYRFKEGFGGQQVTTLPTYSAAYRPVLFGLWQLFYRARFDLDQWRRARAGLPRRQFA